MPITFNAPPAPSPTPERSKTNAGSATGEAEAGPVDHFANILQAAGASKPDRAAASDDAVPHVDTAPVAPAASDAAQTLPSVVSGRRLTRLHQGRDPLRDFLSDPARAPIAPSATAEAIALPGSEDAAVANLAAQASKPLRRGKPDDDATAMLGGNVVLAASAAALAAGAGSPQSASGEASRAARAGGESEIVRASLAAGVAEEARVRALGRPWRRTIRHAASRRTRRRPSQPLSFPADALLRVQESQEKIAGANDFSDKLAEVAAPAMPAAAPAAMPSATSVVSIDTPVERTGWQAEFTAGKLSQVVFMRSDSAEFHLHPAELGPVDVQNQLRRGPGGDLITAPHAASRDALEQALPHLREMLTEPPGHQPWTGERTGREPPAVRGGRREARPGQPRRRHAARASGRVCGPRGAHARAGRYLRLIFPQLPPFHVVIGAGVGCGKARCARVPN